jgi:hypothetical protein
MAMSTEFPVGTTVRFVKTDIARVITIGELGLVVESFAPNTGRNVRLGDGRVVNVPTWYLVEETFFADDEVDSAPKDGCINSIADRVEEHPAPAVNSAGQGCWNIWLGSRLDPFATVYSYDDCIKLADVLSAAWPLLKVYTDAI